MPSTVEESSVIYSITTIAINGGFATSTLIETSYSNAPPAMSSSASSISSNDESDRPNSDPGISSNMLKIAIAVAIVFGVLLAACLIFIIIYIRRRRRRQREVSHSAQVANYPMKGELDGNSSTHFGSSSSSPSLHPHGAPATEVVVGATMNGNDVQEIQKFEMALGLASQDCVTDSCSELESGAAKHDAYELRKADKMANADVLWHEVQGTSVHEAEKSKRLERRSNPTYGASVVSREQDPTTTRFELPERSFSKAGYLNIYTRRPRKNQR